jgi:hypothetical protein
LMTMFNCTFVWPHTLADGRGDTIERGTMWGWQYRGALYQGVKSQSVIDNCLIVQRDTDMTISISNVKILWNVNKWMNEWKVII